MTIVLLAIVALAFVSTGRLTIRRALAAERSQADLQTKWGFLALRSTMSARASQLITQNEVADRNRHACVDLRIILSGRQFELRAADEQAKLDLNRSLDQADPSSLVDLSAQVQRVLGSNRLAQQIELVPSPDAPVRFPSWGHVFRDASVKMLIARDRGEFAAVDLISCDGNGKLNIARAPEIVLQNWFGQTLGPAAINRLIVLRDRSAAKSLSRWADEMFLTDAQKEVFLTQSSLQSQRFSLWIVCGARSVRTVNNGDDPTMKVIEYP